MKTIRVYLLGMWEFRSNWTTYVGYGWSEIYDSGRDMAHRLTLRRFEQ